LQPPIVSNVAKIIPGIPPQQQMRMPRMPLPGMPPHMLPMGMQMPGLPPHMAMAHHPQAGFMPPPPPPDESGASAAKKFRVDDALEPEELWLQKVSGQITVKLSTPQTDEWNLKGQTFTIQLEITSTVRPKTFLIEKFFQVSALKSLIQEQTTVPASKAKLVYQVLFIF